MTLFLDFIQRFLLIIRKLATLIDHFLILIVSFIQLIHDSIQSISKFSFLIIVILHFFTSQFLWLITWILYSKSYMYSYNLYYSFALFTVSTASLLILVPFFWIEFILTPELPLTLTNFSGVINFYYGVGEWDELWEFLI